MAGKNSAQPFTLSREFDAPRDLVWKAMTQKEHMMHWWGPKGFEMVKCENDLRPGGMFHYGMRAPNGAMMWGKMTYKEITPPERLTVVVSFSDENAGVTRHPMSPDWPLETMSTTTLREHGGKTVVTIEWRAYNATDAEVQTFDSSHDSMRMGWGGTMDQLAGYLAQAQKK